MNGSRETHKGCGDGCFETEAWGLNDEGCDSSILKATLLDWKFDRESGFPFFFFFLTLRTSSHIVRDLQYRYFFLSFIRGRIFVVI